MTEYTGSPEIPQHELFIWQKEGITRKIEPADDPDVDYLDFRSTEAATVADIISEEQKRLTLVRANSSFGISEFFLPSLFAELNSLGYGYFHTEMLSAGHADSLPKERNRIIVLDEISYSKGGSRGGLDILSEFLRADPQLRAILIGDDEMNDHLAEYTESARSQDQLSFLEIKPKLFSLEQALQYILKGKPSRMGGIVGTIFEYSTEQQISEILERIKPILPFNAKFLEQLRWLNIFPYNEREIDISGLFKSGNLDDIIRDLVHQDAYLTGIKPISELP